MGGWTPRLSHFAHQQPIAIGIALTIDPFGAGLACLAAVLVGVALVYSLRYFKEPGTLFLVLMLAFLAALCGFVLTGDLFNLFVWFELMSAAGFALCGYKTEESGPIEGALNFAMTNTIGASMVLSGIGLLYGRTGALNFAQLGRACAGQRVDGLLTMGFVLILCGFLIKAAVVPFHFWLADAHAVAPTPVCILFSGIMVELGLYAVMRIYWTVFAAAFAAGTGHLRAVLVGAGCATAVVGAILCFVQSHIKRLLAFSTISHTGLMLIGCGLLSAPALAGVGMYVLAHAFGKSALFLAAGIVLHRLGEVDAVKLHGRGRSICGLWGVALVAAAAWGLNGLPPFASDDGVALIHKAAAAVGYGWTELLFWFAPILTGGAVLSVAGKIYFGWGPTESLVPEGEAQPQEQRETESGAAAAVPWTMWMPVVLLTAAGFGLRYWPGLTNGLMAAGARFQNQAGTIARVLGSGAPVAAAAPVAIHWPELLPGVWVAACATVLAALALVPHLWDGVRPRAGLRRFSAAMGALRRLHSGHLGDYVAWLTVGVSLWGALLAAWRP
jgi:multicomponent Na+:H+ antiporter subunit D